ncbi:galactoside alpha-(1,2)-fucosyltransferase 2-like [Homarus americanus]|uniref:L-Fucosyltransferase n=1 Tax=Homarus americanus TaxID=6706 RepID=A0A8J5NB44_HOMAM|nr:galactoside alpha-(1,2)-fucosyltransferase 2-like [Homarus americanus]KAG7176254.1 Galactoside 2-alpha-L-fucosyltransferase 2-like 1 [Homarus americanus]
MSIKNGRLLFILFSLVLFVIINNGLLLKSRDRVTERNAANSISDNKTQLISTQKTTQELEKTKLEDTSMVGTSTVKADENFIKSQVRETDDVEEKYNKPVRYVMNVLENKTFEGAKDLINNWINSVREYNTIKDLQTQETKAKNNTQDYEIKTSISVIQEVKTISEPDEGENQAQASAAPPDRAGKNVVVSSHHDNKPRETTPWLLTQELPGVGHLAQPVLEITVDAKVHYNTTWHSHPTPILTFKPLGQLGNTMGVYASVWSAGRVYDTPVFMEEEVAEMLRPMFPHLTMSPLPVRMVGGSWLYVGRGSPTLTNYKSLQEAAAGLRGARAIVVDGYPFEMQIFNAFRDDLLEEFTFSHKLRQQAQEHLHVVAAARDKPTSFVGVHIRRTDFAAAFQRMFMIAGPGQDYLRRALDFYRQRLPRVTFVVASDDVDYAVVVLGDEQDVVFAPGMPRELDLAVLAACNHTIITLGSYGFWAGYLSGGTVVYPDLKPRMNEYSFSQAYLERANLTQFIPLPP